MKNYEWILKIIDQASGPLGKIVGSSGAAATALEKTSSGAQGLFFKLSNLAHTTTIVTGLNAAIGGLAQPAVAFESAAADVKAITGATAQQMALMERAAKGVSLEMGGAAAGHLTTYKTLLSELGPKLAQQPAALTSMGRSVAILSKSMGGDTVGAVSALTTGLQQFRVNLTNPTSAAQAMTFQMNVLAAAANAGAAEVPQIAAALKVAGVSASGARVSFVETNAAIQVLAQGGIKGAEAGTALRNVLAKLGEGRFLPKDVQDGLKAAGVDIARLSDKTLPFADRLRALSRIQGDTALVTKMFGAENQNAAAVLLRGIPDLQGYERAITGTNAAVDAAGILMNTHASRSERMRAQWEAGAMAAWKYVEPYGPMIQGASHMGLLLTQLSPVVALAGAGLATAATRTWGFVAAQQGGLVSALRFAGGLAVAGVQGVGTFTLRIAQAVLGLGTFGATVRLQAALALGALQARLASFSFQSFVSGLWASSGAALRAGAAWLWAGVTGLPAMVAGFARATIAQWALNTAMSANPIGAIVLGIMALGTAVYLVIKHWDTVKGWLVNLGKFVLKFNPFALLLEGAKALFPGFDGWLNTFWQKISGFLRTMLGGIKSIWDKVAPYLGVGTMKLPNLTAGLLAGSEGAGNGMGSGGPNAGRADLNAAVRGGLEGVSGGGTKQTTFNIHIAKFQDKTEIHTTTLQGGVNDALEILEEGFLRMLNGVQQLAPVH